MRKRILLSWATWLFPVTLVLLAGSSSAGSSNSIPVAVEAARTDELVFYAWPEDATSVIFDAFTQETGIRVRHDSYESVDDAVKAIRSERQIDVVVMESAHIPELIQSGLLAELDYSHIPNFKYVSANFRDLTYDPGNRHSIPYSWGTTGLVVRTDLAGRRIRRWGDLWSPEYAGRVIFWKTQPRDTLGITLHSLGYSANTEDPAELEQALAHLTELTSQAIWLDDEETSAPWLIDGSAVAAVGWAYDYRTVQETGLPVAYVLPEDGAMLWNDNLVIPAGSRNQAAAESFLNFMLRPANAAQVIDANYYPMAHEVARDLTDPSIRDDPVIYPESSQLRGAELQMPLTPEGQRLYQEIWQALIAKIP